MLSEEDASETQLAKLWPDLSNLGSKSFSGLYNYLKEFGIQKSLVMSTKVRRFAQSQMNKRMRLPALTVRNLELFAPNKKKSKGSLFALLDKTLTRFGSRMLREWVSGPLLVINDIEARLDAVQYFIDNHDDVAKVRRNFH